MYFNLFSQLSENVLNRMDQVDHTNKISSHGKVASSLIEQSIVHFQTKLKEQKYHGYLFDRNKSTGIHFTNGFEVLRYTT